MIAMKLLTAGDFHNRIDFVHSIIKEANSGKYELFIGLGDYYKYEIYRELNEGIKIARIFTTGNWDLNSKLPGNNEYPNLYNFVRVDFKAKDGDYKIILMGAAFPQDFREQILEWVGDFPREKIIVATHYPPYLLRDFAHGNIRAGVPEFRELIIRLKPALWLCAHIHEDSGISRLMKTTVINASIIETGKTYAIEINENGLKDIEEISLK